jgi:hypothetical protein
MRREKMTKTKKRKRMSALAASTDRPSLNSFSLFYSLPLLFLNLKINNNV